MNTRSVFISVLIITFFVFIFSFSNIKKYYLLLLSYLTSFILAFFLNIYSPFLSDQNVVQRAESIEVSYEGSSGRFELWSNALDYIKNHPLIGAGIGNWEIESLPYWKTMLTGYIVPYHAHNDFLEIATEIGILGGVVYFTLFIIIGIYVLSFRKSLFKHNKYIYFLGISMLVYIIDAFFNFPIERPLNQISLIFITAIIVFSFNKSRA